LKFSVKRPNASSSVVLHRLDQKSATDDPIQAAGDSLSDDRGCPGPLVGAT
jgi:hypothetical protein